MILTEDDIDRLLDVADMYPSITMIEGREMLTFLMSKTLSELKEISSKKYNKARLNVHHSVSGRGSMYSKNADRLFKESLVINSYINICHEREDKNSKYKGS